MATEVLLPDGISTNEWDAGTYTDIDEPIESVNHNDLMSTTSTAKKARGTLSNPAASDIENVDSVTRKFGYNGLKTQADPSVMFRVYKGGDTQIGTKQVSINSGGANRTGQVTIALTESVSQAEADTLEWEMESVGGAGDPPPDPVS